MASKKVLGLTAATAALVLGLTACGNGEGDNGGADGETTDEAFQFGILYPQTGSLAFLGPPQVTATQFAVSEINEAGGILGAELPDVIEGDEAGDAGQANEAAQNLIGQGSHAIIGAAASGMTQAVYGSITSNEIVQCSGSNTAPALSDIDDDGYYFRTAPSDVLSGQVLARTIVNDGHQSVAVIVRADDYGDGYASAVIEELENEGVEVLANESYDPDATNFDSVIGNASDDDPDAVALISFEEGAQVLAGLLESGFEGDQLYVADGLNDPNLGETIDSDNPDVVTGVTGVAPNAEVDEFVADLQEFNPDLDVYQFAEQVYDCVVSIALAAEAAGSVQASDYVAEMQNVTQDGTDCYSFQECRDLINEGEDINYEGVSGGIAFADNGDATNASFATFQYGDDGYEILGYESFDLAD